MTVSKVLINFSTSKYTDGDLGTKTTVIIEHMTDNPHFIGENPLLEAVKNAYGNYMLDLGRVEDGTKEDTINKNKSRKELELSLQALGNDVQQKSDGDEGIMVSSGFEVNKKATPVGPLQKATGLSFKTGNNRGSIRLNCDIVINARFYEFEYTDAPSTLNSIWTSKSITKHGILLEGLTSGKQYAFRVSGVGSDPSRSWSDEITSFVL